MHDTSDGEDDSEEYNMHTPDARDNDNTGYDNSTDNVLQAASTSTNMESGVQYSPEQPIPGPAETPLFSAVPTSLGIPAQDPPITSETTAAGIAAGLPTVETNEDHTHQFSLDGPAMCIGRKRKARDLPSILQVCTCGNTVQGGEKSSHEGVIQCKTVGCETGWVSLEMPLGIERDSLR